jgi:hypothetical protein
VTPCYRHTSPIVRELTFRAMSLYSLLHFDMAHDSTVFLKQVDIECIFL